MLEETLDRPQYSVPEPSARLKVCLLGYRSNPYSGGQGIYLRYLSRALVDAGHEVDVISGEPYPHLDDRVKLIKLPGLNLYEAPNHVTALRPRHLLSWTDTFEYFSMLTGGFPEPYTFGRRLVRWFDRVRPDYDIIHDNQSLCYGTLALQRRGLPLVTTIHHPITSDLEIALSQVTDWGHRLLIRRWHSFLGMQKKVVPALRHVVTVSDASRHDIARAFGIPAEGIHVVHNGIDTALFRPQDDVARRPLRIMATASADQPLKGLAYLLRAIAIVRTTHPAIELLVIGKLREGGETERLIHSLGIAGNLTFVSGLTPEQIVGHYAEASIAVVPSLYEGFGLPAGEAMACGVPVISTDGGALPEVVGDAGITVPVRDEHAIAAAILRLLADPDLRASLGHRARARIVEQFSWTLAAKRMTHLYQTVLEGGRVTQYG